MCLFCEKQELLDFYKDKQDLLYRFMDIFNSNCNTEVLPHIISEKVNETLLRSLDGLGDNIKSMNCLSHETTKNMISEKLVSLEHTIETRNIRNKFTPSIRGAISEEELYSTLSDVLSDDWEVIKTTTSGSKRGDIFLQNGVTKIIIDLKDYTTNIPTIQVDKIKRDVTLHSSHGMLVSVNTNIAKHKDYTFEVIGDKILAYISKGDIVTKIKSWANLILSLEKMLHGSKFDKLSLTQKDVDYILNVCKDYDDISKTFKNFLEDNIKRSKNELNKLNSQRNEDIFLFLKSLKN